MSKFSLTREPGRHPLASLPGQGSSNYSLTSSLSAGPLPFSADPLDALGPSEAQLREQAAAEKAEVLQDFFQLLGPLVPEMLRDEKGGLHFEALKTKKFASFEAFKKFLSDHAALNDNKVFRNPYQKLLEGHEFDSLLRYLYQEIDPEQHVLLTASGARHLVQEFQVALIEIDAEAFARNFSGSKEGRQRLHALLDWDSKLSKDQRSDLIKGIYEAGEGKNVVSDVDLVRVTDNISTWNYFNISVTDHELEIAKDGAESILKSIAYYAEKAEETVGAIHESPHAHARILVNGTLQEIPKEKIERFLKLSKEKEKETGVIAQAQAQLARVWLMAANERNFDQLGTRSYGGNLDYEEARALQRYILGQCETLIKETTRTETKGGFRYLQDKIRSFLHDPVYFAGDSKIFTWLEHQARGTSLSDYLSAMPTSLREPLDGLTQLSESWEFSIEEMGEQLFLKPFELKAQDKEFREKIKGIINGLEKAKHGLWYGYKQHKAISRAASNIAEAFNAGDIQDIQGAQITLNALIHQLSQADEEKDIQKVHEQLVQEMEEGGTLYKGLSAAEMDGTEHLLGLSQTMAEMAALAALTRGLSLLNHLKKGKDAVDLAKTGTEVVRAATLSERMGKGFVLGAELATAENALAVATGEVRHGPETVRRWFIDSFATGLAMSVSAGMLPAAANPQQQSLIKNLWARYTAGGIKGIGRLGADTGVEIFEETLDQYVNQVLHGDASALTEAEFTELALICTAGGGAKVGMLAEHVKGEKQKSEVSRSHGPRGNADPGAPAPASGRGASQHGFPRRAWEPEKSGLKWAAAAAAALGISFDHLSDAWAGVNTAPGTNIDPTSSLLTGLGILFSAGALVAMAASRKGKKRKKGHEEAAQKIESAPPLSRELVALFKNISAIESAIERSLDIKEVEKRLPLLPVQFIVAHFKRVREKLQNRKTIKSPKKFRELFLHLYDGLTHHPSLGLEREFLALARNAKLPMIQTIAEIIRTAEGQGENSIPFFAFLHAITDSHENPEVMRKAEEALDLLMAEKADNLMVLDAEQVADDWDAEKVFEQLNESIERGEGVEDLIYLLFRRGQRKDGDIIDKLAVHDHPMVRYYTYLWFLQSFKVVFLLQLTEVWAFEKSKIPKELRSGDPRRINHARRILELLAENGVEEARDLLLAAFESEDVPKGPKEPGPGNPGALAIAAPGIFGLDFLLHGQPTFTGLLLTGIATALGVLGIFSKSRPKPLAITEDPYDDLLKIFRGEADPLFDLHIQLVLKTCKPEVGDPNIDRKLALIEFNIENLMDGSQRAQAYLHLFFALGETGHLPEAADLLDRSEFRDEFNEEFLRRYLASRALEMEKTEGKANPIYYLGQLDRKSLELVLQEFIENLAKEGRFQHAGALFEKFIHGVDSALVPANEAEKIHDTFLYFLMEITGGSRIGGNYFWIFMNPGIAGVGLGVGLATLLGVSDVHAAVDAVSNAASSHGLTGLLATLGISLGAWAMAASRKGKGKKEDEKESAELDFNAIRRELENPETLKSPREFKRLFTLLFPPLDSPHSEFAEKRALQISVLAANANIAMLQTVAKIIREGERQGEENGPLMAFFLLVARQHTDSRVRQRAQEILTALLQEKKENLSILDTGKVADHWDPKEVLSQINEALAKGEFIKANELASLLNTRARRNRELDIAFLLFTHDHPLIRYYMYGEAIKTAELSAELGLPWDNFEKLKILEDIRSENRLRKYYAREILELMAENGVEEARDLLLHEFSSEGDLGPRNPDKGGSPGALAIAGPAISVIETLLNGHPSVPGFLLGGLTLLATSWMVMGVFSRLANWFKTTLKNTGGLGQESTIQENESDRALPDLFAQDMGFFRGEFLEKIDRGLQERFFQNEFVMPRDVMSTSGKKGFLWKVGGPVRDGFYFGIIGEASQEEYEAYESWRKQTFFSSGITPRDHPAFTQLVRLGDEISVKIEARSDRTQPSFVPLSPQQLDYVRAILAVFPKDFFKGGPLKEIHQNQTILGGFFTPDGSAYSDGIIYLYPEVFRGPRFILLGTLLHELGHSTADRIEKGIGFSQEEGEALIEAFNLIRDFDPKRYFPGPNHTIYTLRNWVGDPLNRIDHIGSKFDEFVAELHLIYVVDREGWRHHIERLKTKPETEEQGKAYEIFYNLLRDRVFKSEENKPSGAGHVPGTVVPGSAASTGEINPPDELDLSEKGGSGSRGPSSGGAAPLILATIGAGLATLLSPGIGHAAVDAVSSSASSAGGMGILAGIGTAFGVLGMAFKKGKPVFSNPTIEEFFNQAEQGNRMAYETLQGYSRIINSPDVQKALEYLEPYREMFDLAEEIRSQHEGEREAMRQGTLAGGIRRMKLNDQEELELNDYKKFKARPPANTINLPPSDPLLRRHFSHSILGLNAANQAFLQAGLDFLVSRNAGLVQFRDYRALEAFEGALRGEISVLDAAAVLLKFHETAHIEMLQQGLVDPEGRTIEVVDRVIRYPLREIDRRLENPPPELLEFLQEFPDTDLEITELVTKTDKYNEGMHFEYRQYKDREDSPLLTHNPIVALLNLKGLGRIYDAWIHPPGSRIWRYPPLQLIFYLIKKTFGERALGLQFFQGEATLDELRNLLAEDRWPLWIAAPSASMRGSHPLLLDIHGTPSTAYRVFTHDLWHALHWSQKPREWRQDMVQVYDAMVKCLRNHSSDLQNLWAISEFLGSVLAEHKTNGWVVTWLESYLPKEVEKGAISPELAEKVKVDFLQQLRQDLKANPRLGEILGGPSSGGKIFTLAGPAIPVIETLLHGHPSVPGFLLGGLTLLAGSEMVMGVFSWLAEWAKVKFFNPTNTKPISQKSLQSSQAHREAKKRELIQFAQHALEKWKQDPETLFDYGNFFLEVEAYRGNQSVPESQKDKIVGWWQKILTSLHAAVRAPRNFGDNEVERAIRMVFGPHPDIEVQMSTLAHQFLKTISIHSDDKPNLSDFFLCGRGNCSARAKFVLSAGMSLSPQLPKGLRWAVQNYDNHLETVLYDEREQKIWVLSSGELKRVGKIEASLFHPALFFHAFLKQNGILSPVTVENLLLLEVPEDPNAKYDLEPHSFGDPFEFPATSSHFKPGETFRGQTLLRPDPVPALRRGALLLIAGLAASLLVQGREEDSFTEKNKTNPLPENPKGEEGKAENKIIVWDETVRQRFIFQIRKGEEFPSFVRDFGFYIDENGDIIVKNPELKKILEKLSTTQEKSDFLFGLFQKKENDEGFKKAQSFLLDPVGMIHNANPEELEELRDVLEDTGVDIWDFVWFLRGRLLKELTPWGETYWMVEKLKSSSPAWHTFFTNLEIWNQWLKDHPKEFFLLLNEVPLEKKMWVLRLAAASGSIYLAPFDGLSASRPLFYNEGISLSQAKEDQTPFDPSRGPQPVAAWVEIDLAASDFTPPSDLTSTTSSSTDAFPSSITISPETALIFAFGEGFFFGKTLSIQNWSPELTRIVRKLNEDGRYDFTLKQNFIDYIFSGKELDEREREFFLREPGSWMKSKLPPSLAPLIDDLKARGEKFNWPPSKPPKNDGIVPAHAGLAIPVIETLLSGHPSVPGFLLGALTMLASSGMVGGLFDFLGKKIKGIFSKSPDSQTSTDTTGPSSPTRDLEVVREKSAQEFVNWLRGLLTDANPITRKRAIRALVRLEVKEAAEDLRNILNGRDAPAELQAEAARGLGKIWNTDSEATLSALWNCLKASKDSKVVGEVAKAMVQRHWRAAALDGLLSKLKDPDPEAQEAAVLALARIDAREGAVVDGLLELLHSEGKPRKNIVAGQALLRLGVEYKALQGLRRLIDPAAGWFSSGFVEAMGLCVAFGIHELVPEFRRIAQENSDPFIRAAARRAFQSLQNQANAIRSAITAERVAEFNERILSGDGEAIFQGGVYYLTDHESVGYQTIGGGAGPDHFYVNAWVDKKTGQIVSVGKLEEGLRKELGFNRENFLEVFFRIKMPPVEGVLSGELTTITEILIDPNGYDDSIPEQKIINLLKSLEGKPFQRPDSKQFTSPRVIDGRKGNSPLRQEDDGGNLFLWAAPGIFGLDFLLNGNQPSPTGIFLTGLATLAGSGMAGMIFSSGSKIFQRWWEAFLEKISRLKGGSPETIASGEPETFLLEEDQELPGNPHRIIGKKGTEVHFHANGRLNKVTLAKPVKIEGVGFEEGDTLLFDEKGELTFVEPADQASEESEVAEPPVPTEAETPVSQLKKGEPIFWARYREIAQKNNWDFSLVMGRVLRHAPIDEVKAFLETQYPGDPLAQLTWLSEYQIEAGRELLKDPDEFIFLQGGSEFPNAFEASVKAGEVLYLLGEKKKAFAHLHQIFSEISEGRSFHEIIPKHPDGGFILDPQLQTIFLQLMAKDIPPLFLTNMDPGAEISQQLMHEYYERKKTFVPEDLSFLQGEFRKAWVKLLYLDLLSDQDRLKVAEALLEFRGMGKLFPELYQALGDPKTAPIAARLLDQLDPGWDQRGLDP